MKECFKAPSTGKIKPDRTPIERKVLNHFTVERLLEAPMSEEALWKAVQADPKLAFCDEAMFNKSVEHYLGSGKVVDAKGKLSMAKK